MALTLPSTNQFEKEIYQARDAAITSLRLCATPNGLMASGARHGHHQVWARDSMITLLGARFINDPVISNSLHASINILRHHASRVAAIPNNIDPKENKANYRAYADSGLWWVIGSSLLAPDPQMTDKILNWYECHDIDQSGLISMQESADWQDLFCTRGKGLYLNCLYVMALRAAAKCNPQKSEEYLEQAEQLVTQINRWFWYSGDNNMLRHIAHTFSTDNVQEYDSLGRKRWLPEKKLLLDEHYYLPYLGFRAVGEWFDTFGHCLAIIGDIASPEQTNTILDFFSRYRLGTPPICSLYPIIKPGDSDWRDYYGTLNMPYCYHNGGIWPFIGGFYIAALIKAGRQDEAEAALLDLAKLNLEGNFNEWHHGDTQQAMGVEHQAWSAGMYLYALECVMQSKVA